MGDERDEAGDRELLRTTLAWRVGVLEGAVEKHDQALDAHERELREMPQNFVPRTEHAEKADHTARNFMILLGIVNVAAAIANFVGGH